MRREQLQIYPRGFFGAALNYAPPQPEDPTNVAERVQSLNPLDFTAQLLDGGKAALPINHDIERLYALKVNNAPQAMKFDFIVDILRAALFAFGTINFGQWVLAQEKSPYVTWAHSEFMVDTIRFIECKDRNLLLEMWPSMMSDKASTGAYDAAKVRQALKESRLATQSMEEVIRNWVSRNAGVWDMLTSIHILFGN
jgi:hypothetical protein